MTQISLSKSHNKSQEEVEKLVCKIEEELCPKYQLNSSRQGQKIIFKRQGVDGELSIADQRVDINIKLGMMTRLLAPQIESTLREKLDKYLS